jgi:hypothetical protein
VAPGGDDVDGKASGSVPLVVGQVEGHGFSLGGSESCRWVAISAT